METLRRPDHAYGYPIFVVADASPSRCFDVSTANEGPSTLKDDRTKPNYRRSIYISISLYLLMVTHFLKFFNIFKSFCKIIRPLENLSVLTTNRRGSQRFLLQPPWARRLGQQPRAPTGVKVSRCGPRRLRPIRRALRRQVQPP
jgi:hypothetical protein